MSWQHQSIPQIIFKKIKGEREKKEGRKKGKERGRNGWGKEGRKQKEERDASKQGAVICKSKDSNLKK